MFMKEKNHYSIKEIKKRMTINDIFKMQIGIQFKQINI